MAVERLDRRTHILAYNPAYGAGDDEVPVLGTYEKTPERWYSNVFRGFSLRASGGS